MEMLDHIDTVKVTTLNQVKEARKKAYQRIISQMHIDPDLSEKWFNRLDDASHRIIRDVSKYIALVKNQVRNAYETLHSSKFIRRIESIYRSMATLQYDAARHLRDIFRRGFKVEMMRFYYPLDSGIQKYEKDIKTAIEKKANATET